MHKLLKVLWAESSHDLAKTCSLAIEELLPDHGISITHAYNTQEAYQLFIEKRDQFDLVVADVLLPIGEMTQIRETIIPDKSLLTELAELGNSGGLVWTSLAVEYLRQEAGIFTLKMPIPVVYISSEFRHSDFYEYLQKWHESESYFWWFTRYNNSNQFIGAIKNLGLRPQLNPT